MTDQKERPNVLELRVRPGMTFVQRGLEEREPTPEAPVAIHSADADAIEDLRVPDSVVAKIIGYTCPNGIRHLVEQNEGMLKDYGGLNGGGGGYFLNKRQVVLLAMFHQRENVDVVNAEIVQVSQDKPYGEASVKERAWPFVRILQRLAWQASVTVSCFMVTILMELLALYVLDSVVYFFDGRLVLPIRVYALLLITAMVVAYVYGARIVKTYPIIFAAAPSSAPRGRR